MKKSFIVLFFSLFAVSAFAQDKGYIVFDQDTVPDFNAEFRKGLSMHVLRTGLGPNTYLQLALPPDNGNRPVPGTYTLADGKAKAIKKGSGIARLMFGLRHISTEESGTVEVSYADGLYTFIMNDIKLVDKKSNEVHHLTARVTMFIPG
ncbi:MAG: hypothetical protein HYZ15_02160 [Sphingobacteriales bacterium]|nr:hypothetical protein [Sphingobacteriales bacterium]